MDTLTLVKNMIREIKMTDRNFSGKVAKITGQGLNQKEMQGTLEELRNGALIIEDAGGMNRETAISLYRSLQQEKIYHRNHMIYGLQFLYPGVKRKNSQLVNRELHLSGKTLLHERRYGHER